MLHIKAVEPGTFSLLKILIELPSLIDLHKQKYPSQMLAISIPHAITYFADAENSETPVGYYGQTWELVKNEISHKVSDYLR